MSWWVHPDAVFSLPSRRFHHSLTDNNRWIRERSHESYAKNYSVVFPHDEPLAGRNMRKDPLHEVRTLTPTRAAGKELWETLTAFLQQKRGGKEWPHLYCSPKHPYSHPSIHPSREDPCRIPELARCTLRGF